MLIDLFSYSKATQGGLFGIEALLEAARCARLDALCITDRDASWHAHEILKKVDHFDFFIGIGLELETNAGTLCVFPSKIDNDFVQEKWRDHLGEYPDVQDTINYFKDSGAAIIARNLYLNGSGLKDRIYTLQGIDAIDVLAPNRRRIDNELALEAQQALTKPGVAGSGVFDILSEMGHVATLINADAYTQEELVQALQGADLWPLSLRSLGEAAPVGAKRESFAPKRESSDGRGRRRNDDRRSGRRNESSSRRDSRHNPRERRR